MNLYWSSPCKIVFPFHWYHRVQKLLYMDQNSIPDDPAGCKSKQPDSFNCEHDFFAVSTWIFKMKQHFHLMEVFKPGILANYESRKCLLLVSWRKRSNMWYTLVQSSSAPDTWSNFCESFRLKFVTADYSRRTRDSFGSLSKIDLFFNIQQNLET